MMLAAPKSKQKEKSILPHQAPFIAPQTPPSSTRTSRLLLGCVFTLAFLCWNRSRTSNAWGATLQPFYAHVKTVENICPVVDGPGISHSGHIGLKGDSEDSPKRLFFWYFEAEQDAANAPIIMTIGGGPGTSGMMNPMMAQGPCVSAENGTTKPNPNRWTERYNLLALDHPVGVGFSYGRMVNNSRDAAIDTYDFLQKFFRLYPHLSQNKFVLSGGSYGGTYVPHIATVIHEQNLALAAGAGPPGARHNINLESLMLSNPMSDATSHFTWFLQTTCHGPVEMYNASTCSHMYERLPACLDSIRTAEQSPEWNPVLRKKSHELCWYLRSGDMHGVVGEDYRKKCVSDDPLGCLPPDFGWATAFFNRSDVKTALLGVDAHRNFTHLSEEVFNEFYSYGDTMQSAYLLYEPLLRSGIRLLHYVGSKDANCNYHGIMSFLKLIKSPFQYEFLRAPDVPWPGPTAGEEAEATVRVVGEGAGNMTWILIDGGGHFIAHDQPKLVKSIVEHWVENVPFN